MTDYREFLYDRDRHFLYLINGWDLRPELSRASYRPKMKTNLLKKFGSTINFITYFC